jgi:hypothetical protein
MSVKSYASSRMSGASGAPRVAAAAEIAPDTMSMRSDESHLSRPLTNYSHLNEEDEWTAIMNFNTILHYEEMKQALMREKERK